MNPFIAISRPDPFAGAMGGGYQAPAASSAPPSWDMLRERQARLQRLGLEDTVLGDASNFSMDMARRREAMQAHVRDWAARQAGMAPAQAATSAVGGTAANAAGAAGGGSL
jgi:hypothetical protein